MGEFEMASRSAGGQSDVKESHVSVNSSTGQDGDGDGRVISEAYPNIDNGHTEPAILRRIFGFIQLLAFAIMFMLSWEVIALNGGAVFYNGGPSALTWGTLLVVIGALSQALSLAEMAAIQPIAGAQYHWTFLTAPDEYRRFITWMQGWVTWFAWVSVQAGVCASMGNILLGLVAVNYPSYEFHSWHITVLVVAILASTGAINSYFFRFVPSFELAGGVLHVVMFIIFVVVLAVMAPSSSNEFVFTRQISSSGWENSYISWNLGMLVPAWGFIGFDGVVHLGEEVRQAKRSAPRAMVWTILLNGILCWAFVLTLMYKVGNLDDVLNNPYPIIPICINATGSRRAGTAMISALLILDFCNTVASVASASRITWAWARDGALPKYFAHIDPKTKVPTRATWFPCLIVALLSLLSVGSTASTAFAAFNSLSSLGLYTSYIIVISCIMHARWTGRLGDKPSCAVQYGEWRLPKRLATPINIYALIWTCYLTVWLPFPTAVPVTGGNMNYAGPVYLVVTGAALVWWFLWGKKKWPGLNLHAIRNVDVAG